MSNPGENSLNCNGSTDPLQRLASFKAPRDLTLGGAKPNKKIFIPNLNVSRNKNKGPTVGSRENKRDDKIRKDRKNDRNRNNNRHGPQVIKSGGVFSEGLGASERHSSRVSYSRDSDSTQTLQKPTIRMKDFIKLDSHSREIEEKKIKSLVDGGSGDGEDDASVDFKTIKDKDAPIKLPMDDGATILPRAIPIKKEEVFEESDVINILRNEQPTLLLLQLPDTLPGRGGSADDDHPRKSAGGHLSAASTSTSDSNADENEPAENRCLLSDLEEGRVGRLLVHRSGRVMLKLGDTMFEVCSGTKPAFYQEAVSVAIDHSSRSANLIALGPLHHKLNLVPDWEALFAEMHT